MHTFPWIWKELGIKIKIFRHHSQQLCHPLTNTKAVLIVKTEFLQQPHSLIHFSPSIPALLRETQKVHVTWAIPQAPPAFCRAGKARKHLFCTDVEAKEHVICLSSSRAARSWQAGWVPCLWPCPERWEAPAAFGFRWGLWMFTTNGNQSQGTRQEWKGHKKAVVTSGYSVQLKKQAKKVRGIGSFLWAFWINTIQTKKKQDTWQMFSLPNWSHSLCFKNSGDGGIKTHWLEFANVEILPLQTDEMHLHVWAWLHFCVRERSPQACLDSRVFTGPG